MKTPSYNTPSSPAYEPTRDVASFHIHGFKHHEGPFVLSKLKAGKKLDLVPEPDNPYDPCAMAIYRKGKKLGYVPRDENGMMSLLSYFGHDVFECRIMQVDPEADPWKQVRVGIYVKDARK